MTLDWQCSVNLIKLFLFGIKDKLKMKKVKVEFSDCSCKCVVIKIFKSTDLLLMFLYIRGEYCSKVVITC